MLPRPDGVSGSAGFGLARCGEKAGKSVAVPLTGSPARPSFSQAVQEEFTFCKLRFPRHRTKTGKAQWKGAESSFTSNFRRGFSIIAGCGAIAHPSSN